MAASWEMRADPAYWLSRAGRDGVSPKQRTHAPALHRAIGHGHGSPGRAALERLASTGRPGRRRGLALVSASGALDADQHRRDRSAALRHSLVAGAVEADRH